MRREDIEYMGETVVRQYLYDLITALDELDIYQDFFAPEGWRRALMGEE